MREIEKILFDDWFGRLRLLNFRLMTLNLVRSNLNVYIEKKCKNYHVAKKNKSSNYTPDTTLLYWMKAGI